MSLNFHGFKCEVWYQKEKGKNDINVFGLSNQENRVPIHWDEEEIQGASLGGMTRDLFLFLDLINLKYVSDLHMKM